jgi:hypothetical protein
MHFLGLIEGFYHLREPITFSSSIWRISFLKNYTKFSPLVLGVLIAGLVAWAVYSGTELIWLAIGLGIFAGGIGYGSAWLGVWLVRKFFISYISDYQKVFEPKSKQTDKARTYAGLRVFWIFTGLIVLVAGLTVRPVSRIHAFC